MGGRRTGAFQWLMHRLFLTKTKGYSEEMSAVKGETEVLGVAEKFFVTGDGFSTTSWMKHDDERGLPRSH